MRITEILDDTVTPNPEAVAMHTKLPDRAAALATHSLGGDMPDFLPVMYSVTWTLDKLYSRIKAGKFCSTNTDDMVVFGGGLAGCEIAVHLGMPGKRCTSLRCGINFPPDAIVRHRPLLLKEIEKYVTVHTSCKGKEVRRDGILLEDAEGNEVLIPGTTVICALGHRSKSDEAALMDSGPFVRIIGDASRVSAIMNAMYWGYHAAQDI